MDTAKRRQEILHLLSKSGTPLSAGELAGRLGVSRQIIVGDVALLRAGGQDILATPRGYLLAGTDARSALRKIIACRHTEEGMARELQICVDHGCTVLDVIVEHPVYGQLCGLLELSTRLDVELFLQRVAGSEARSLSELTNGIHLHTLQCPSEEAFGLVCARLSEEGFLLTT